MLLVSSACHVKSSCLATKVVAQVLKAVYRGCLQVVFKPIPEVWGYFSVKGGGGIHEFSDSQVSTCDMAQWPMLLRTFLNGTV
jgi:acetyl-CoA carboxylase/biotin carboxylase 1